MTREGFFSVVQHREDKTQLCVRARRRGDLLRLSVRLGVVLAIDNRKDADYQWAATVDRRAFQQYMADSVAEIDYTTGVKDHIDCGEHDRHVALYKVWDAMMTLQEGTSRYSRL